MDWQEDMRKKREETERQEELVRETASLELAQALSKRPASCKEELRKKCFDEATLALMEISELASKFGYSKGIEHLRGQEVTVQEVEWGGGANDMIEGSVIVRRRGRDFNAPRVLAPRSAALAAIRTMMEAHEWFCEGLDLEEREGDHEELTVLRAFLIAAKSQGGYAGALAAMVASETECNHKRWRATMFLENMIKRAADEGLLPSGFARSRIMLGDGWPGEPTQLWRWEIKPAVAMSHFDGYDPRESIKGKGRASPPDLNKEWELPSLDAGIPALWSAFCEKVALAQAHGWSSLPTSFGNNSEQARREANIERKLLGEVASQAA